MTYYVRTTSERQLDTSFNQISYNLIIDREHKPIDSFIDALYLISNEDAVLMEDDIILCQNFEEEITKVIKQYPNRIINFFRFPSPMDTEETEKIIYNQCTFYPKGIAKQIADIMVALPRRTDSKKNMYSLLENEALIQLDQKVVQYVPHLVQHLDNDSILFTVTLNIRRSNYFLDYVKELGIDYAKDGLKGHTKELCQLKIEHFNQLQNDSKGK